MSLLFLDVTRSRRFVRAAEYARLMAGQVMDLLVFLAMLAGFWLLIVLLTQ